MGQGFGGGGEGWGVVTGIGLTKYVLWVAQNMKNTITD